jgi:Holliday junction resolvase RusA-like endonuclease
MPAILSIILLAPPRTKKNSGQFVSIGRGDKKRNIILPSKAYREWESLVLGQAKKQGGQLCIDYPVNARAVFYRERMTGDAVGYYQAIADVLQKAGVLKDDRWIVSWDGSRLDKDPVCPRVEVELTEAVKADGSRYDYQPAMQLEEEF